MPRYKTELAWFSHLVHMARKWSESILTTLEPARGLTNRECMILKASS